MDQPLIAFSTNIQISGHLKNRLQKNQCHFEAEKAFQVFKRDVIHTMEGHHQWSEKKPR